MPDELTRLAETILALDKGVEKKREELSRLQGQVIEATRSANALETTITKRTSAT